MAESYEKNGIIYFKTPYKVSCTEWVMSHLDCDSLVTAESLELEDDDIVYVRCYARSKEYNRRLRFEVLLKELRDEDLRVLGNFSSEEVNCID